MNARNKSYVMLIASMLIFGTIGIFRRYIPLSSGLLSCIRGVLGSLVLIAFVIIKKINFDRNISIRNLILLIVTGALIGFNWILLFEAYNYTTVATATLCYYMQPTIVMLAAPLILREKLTGKKLLSVIISIVGMILVSGIFDTSELSLSAIKGISFGLGAAVLYAMVIILNKLINIDNAYEKTIIQLSSAAIVLIPYILFTEDFGNIVLSRISLIMILIVGIVHTGIAYAMYFASMKDLDAHSIALLSYLDPVSALILSALFLHEGLSIWGIVGAILIIGAALISELSTSD